MNKYTYWILGISIIFLLAIILFFGRRVYSPIGEKRASPTIIIPTGSQSDIEEGTFIRFETANQLEHISYSTKEGEKSRVLQQGYLLSDQTKRIEKNDFLPGDTIAVRLIEVSPNLRTAIIIINYSHTQK